MNENGEKDINSEEADADRGSIDIDIDEKEESYHDAIEGLLSGLDLPGDKEIDRSVSTDFAFSDPEEGEDEAPKEADYDKEESIGKEQHYRANPTVQYNRPNLKTDKVKRVTKEAVDSLFKDLDMVMAGEKPSEEKPVWGKELETEKKVSDLAKEEVSGDDLYTEDNLMDKEPFSYDKSDKDDSPQDSPQDREVSEELDDKKDTDFIDLEWTEEDELSLDDVKSQLEGIDGTVSDDAADATLADATIKEETTKKKDMLQNEEKSKEAIEQNITDKELSIKQDTENFNDIDSEIADEVLSPPISSIDKITPDSEEETTKTDIKTDTEFDDFDSYIKDEETKAENAIVTENLIQKEITQETDPIDTDDTNYDIQSEFTGLTPLQDEDSKEDKDKKTVEIKAEDDMLSADIESADKEEKKEIYNDTVVDKSQDEADEDRDILPDPTISDAQSLIDSIVEPELTNGLKENIKKTDTITENNTYPEELLIKETTSSEKIEESFSTTIPQEIEEDLQEKKAPATTQQEAKDLEFTTSEIKLIQENLSKLPQPLKDITTDIIVKEKLPHNDIRELTQELIIGSNASVIKKMLEDKLNITIKITKEDTTTLLEKEKKSNTLLGLVVSFIFLIILSIPIWFFVLKPYIDTENKYEAGLSDIQKGTKHYNQAIKKFIEAKGNSDGDRKWYILYAQEFLKQANPKAYYYAHTFLLGDDPKNKLFLQKYYTENQNNKNNKTIKNKRQNPGAEKVQKKIPNNSENNSPIVSNLIKYGIIHYIPKDKDALFTLAESYIKKAIWAANNKDTINNKINWDDVDYYLNQAINKAYQPLTEINQNDQEVLDKEARTYILWAQLLQNVKPELKEKKLNLAENNYNKILTEYPNSTTGLYGLLLLYLSKEELNNELQNSNQKITTTINSIYKAIEKLEIKTIDEEILSKFAFYLLQKQNKIKQAQIILNKVIRKGKIYPKAYYYLGLLYNKERDIEKSLESYIKGIFAFYYLKIGEEKFFTRISNISNKFQRSNIMNTQMLNAINTVIKDTDPINSKLQSMLFNKIGENILKLSYDLRKEIEEERKEQKHILYIAQKSFLLALQKQPSNYKPWKNIGDLAYFEGVQQTQFFLENLPKKQITKFQLLYKLKELNQFKKAKYYYQNTLKLMVENKYINTNENTNNNTKTQLRKNLLNTLKSNKIDPDLFYKLGFIFYHEHNYKQASEIWHSIKTIPTFKFNPTLNFALANSYLRIGEHREARRHYQNAIDFYKTIASRYKNSPNPYSKKQNEVFAKLAKNHNNMGVSYHIMGEKLNNYKFKEYARLHYFQAREYASKLNNDILIAKELWNQNILNSNYIALTNYNISLKKRLKNKQKPRKKMQTPPSTNPLDYMLIENIEYILK